MAVREGLLALLDEGAPLRLTVVRRGTEIVLTRHGGTLRS